MKKLLINLIIIISIFGGIYYAIPLLKIGNMYGFLIKMTIIITILIPKIINKIFKITIPSTLELIYVIFIFLAHFLGSIVDFYHQIYWYDTFIHFLSGILVAFLATYLIIATKVYNGHNIFIWFLFIISASCLVATAWEIFEFVCDKIFNADAQNVFETGVDDTMIDMIVALLGSLLYGITFIYEKINNINGIISKYIKSIY